MSSHTLECNTWEEAFNTFEKSVSTFDEHVEIINGTTFNVAIRTPGAWCIQGIQPQYLIFIGITLLLLVSILILRFCLPWKKKLSCIMADPCCCCWKMPELYPKASAVPIRGDAHATVVHLGDFNSTEHQ